MIERVEVRGAAPFLGMESMPSGEQIPMYSRNPDMVMRWLCDGWRCRFNQLRSRRSKWDRDREQLVPIGQDVDNRTDREARGECSWLAAIPAMILQSPNRIENTEWWAANKRRKTLKKQHRNPGAMPRFKKKSECQRFICWHNKGANANYRQFNRHHGEVVITGQNPKQYQLEGEPCRWSLHIRIRISQPIRDYTSVGVDWKNRTVTFINEPLPIRRKPTRSMVGIDRGATHTIATSTDEFIDLPKERLNRIDREIRRRQKAQARRIAQSGETTREYRKNPSNTYTRVQGEIRALHGKAHRIIEDWQNKVTTRLIREHDIIVLEDLQLTNMTRKAKPKKDPDREGRYLPNGQSAKRGLNRAMRSAALGGIQAKLEYKTSLTGTNRLILVNPAYTSQTCSECQYCSSGNRKSQAVFHCGHCGMGMNADLNAAKVILQRGYQHLLGGDAAQRASTVSDAPTPNRGRGASAGTRKTIA